MSDVTVIGNIGEPNLKFTPNGKAVLEFSLAENHSKKNQQGGWDDDGTTWRRVTVWDKKAESLGEVLRKGDRVIVTGAERIREWEGKDGGKGQSLELNAREVGVVPRASQGQRTAPAQADWGSNNAGDWGNPADNTPPF